MTEKAWKYKPGDKVRVRKDLKVGKRYGDIMSGMTAQADMAKLAGTVVTILAQAGVHEESIEIWRDNYRIAEGSYLWHADMFEPVEEEEKTANKYKYKVGEKVMVRKDLKAGPYGDSRTRVSATPEMVKLAGKIVTIKSRPFPDNPCFADNYGIAKSGHIWHADMFEPIPDECRKKIVLTVSGRTTIARLYDGEELIATQSAKCNPADEFSFEVGARLAMKRLIGGEPEPEEKPEEPEWFTGKAVCISSTLAPNEATVGKIYEFEDGCWKSDNGYRNHVEMKVRKEGMKATARDGEHADFLEIKED